MNQVVVLKNQDRSTKLMIRCKLLKLIIYQAIVSCQYCISDNDREYLANFDRLMKNCNLISLKVDK